MKYIVAAVALALATPAHAMTAYLTGYSRAKPQGWNCVYYILEEGDYIVLWMQDKCPRTLH